MKRRSITLALALLALSIATGVELLELGIIRFNHPDRREFPVWGIDVSHHQEAIDWRSVAASKEIEFAFIKATEGGDFVDPRFEENWRASRDATLKRGAYHFFSLCRSGIDQAEHFIRVVPREPDALPAVADLEFGGACKRRPPRAEAIAELNAWIARVRDHYGRTPILYVTYEFYDAYLAGSSVDAELWVRDIIRRPKLPDSRRWLFWQFANRGRVRGIDGPVDLDAFCCDRNAWRDFTSAELNRAATRDDRPR